MFEVTTETLLTITSMDGSKVPIEIIVSIHIIYSVQDHAELGTGQGSIFQ